MRRVRLVVVLGAVTLLVGGCFLLGMGDRATLTVAQGTGPSPTLPPPNKTLLPTVDIAPAIGWPAGARPTPAPGLAVTAFADGLDHPRWLYEIGRAHV